MTRLKFSVVLAALAFVLGCATPTTPRPQISTSKANMAPLSPKRVSAGKKQAPPGPQSGSHTLAPLTTNNAPAPVRGLFGRRGKGPSAKEISSSCADKASGALWFCAADRWFAGENRDAQLTHPGTGPGDVLRGVDLGTSVRFGSKGQTFFYMGDSFGRIAKGACGLAKHQDFCNDAVLVGDLGRVRNPEEGIPVDIVVPKDSANQPEGFVPIVIDGINGRNPLPLCRANGQKPSTDPCLGKFNTPTGALTARLSGKVLRERDEAPREVVLLWFATAQALYDESAGRTLAASFLAVSEDGVSFRKLIEAPFSREKFINVAPVLVTKDQRLSVCQSEASSLLCHNSLTASGDIALLFGAGRRYRKSPLFLAALDLQTLEVRYYSGDPNQPWSKSEATAAPVIGADDPKPVEQFGELSVGLVPASACPAEARSRCEDTLVLLANQAGFIRYRTALLSAPAQWSVQRKSSGFGYGPYIIEDLTKVKQSESGGLELELYHVLSSWDGKPLKTKQRNPYGVFTRRLTLVGAEACGDNDLTTADCLTHPPIWPPKPGPKPMRNKPR